jgi:hypothetical protein
MIRAGSRYNLVDRIEVTNAHPFAIEAEVTVFLDDGEELVRADLEPEQTDGRPLFRIRVPANSTAEVRYQTVG